jgi:flagellin
VTDGAFGTAQLLDGTVTHGTDAADAVEESGGSHLYLEMMGADTYSFTLNTVAIDFTYTGTSSSRDAIAQEIEVALNAGTADTWSVVNQNGRLELTNQSATDMALSAFTSDGNGKILASTAAGEESTQGSTEILDDTVSAVTASTVAAGLATATDVDFEFTAADTYSFKISDGVRTAIVDPTEIADVTDASDMLAAINYALEQAGMDSSISAAHASGVITLTQAAGREITISDFLSDGAGSMTAVAGAADVTGIARYLDDGMGTSASTVSEINISTSSGAQDALDILDRALQDVASERSSLGAVSNRLDHTINNLGNVVVNTESAQSRIEDADFAKETANLTKNQIMSQAATAMLAQANASKQGVLSLLQG